MTCIDLIWFINLFHWFLFNLINQFWFDLIWIDLIYIDFYLIWFDLNWFLYWFQSLCINYLRFDGLLWMDHYPVGFRLTLISAGREWALMDSPATQPEIEQYSQFVCPVTRFDCLSRAERVKGYRSNLKKNDDRI